MTAILSPTPVLDIPDQEEPAVFSALAEPARLELLIRSARRTYTPIGVRIADARSRSWGARSVSPFAPAVDEVDRALGRPGAYLLNYSYEWGCTTGAGPDRKEGGSTLFRTLDWPFDGLGRALVVLRSKGPAGAYLSITWPGYAGVLTGLAAGRFAAAINQPPLPLPALGRAVGWMTARSRVNRSRALPPSHLLRMAFERCATFREAVELIRRTPICLPAIFTLAGTDTGAAVVIERTTLTAFDAPEPIAANHWTAEQAPPGRARNPSSQPRRAAMHRLIERGHDWSLDWLRPPILQPDTRLAVMANPISGRLLVQGWETSGPATAILSVNA